MAHEPYQTFLPYPSFIQPLRVPRALALVCHCWPGRRSRVQIWLPHPIEMRTLPSAVVLLLHSLRYPFHCFSQRATMYRWRCLWSSILASLFRSSGFFARIISENVMFHATEALHYERCQFSYRLIPTPSCRVWAAILNNCCSESAYPYVSRFFDICFTAFQKNTILSGQPSFF